MPEMQELKNDVSLLNKAVFGDRNNPDDVGLKSDMKTIKEIVKEILRWVKWSVALVLSIIITALLGLVVRGGHI